jgi:hypothetical protein
LAPGKEDGVSAAAGLVGGAVQVGVGVEDRLSQVVGRCHDGVGKAVVDELVEDIAGVLVEGLREGVSLDLVDSYEATRRAVARSTITMTDRLTRAANARNPLLRAARNTAFTLAGHLEPVKRNLAMNLSELRSDNTSTIVDIPRRS